MSPPTGVNLAQSVNNNIINFSGLHGEQEHRHVPPNLFQEKARVYMERQAQLNQLWNQWGGLKEQHENRYRQQRIIRKQLLMGQGRGNGKTDVQAEKILKEEDAQFVKNLKKEEDKHFGRGAWDSVFGTLGAMEVVGKMATDPDYKDRVLGQFGESFFEVLIAQIYKDGGFIDAIFGEKAPEVRQEGPFTYVWEKVEKVVALIAPFSEFMNGINGMLGFNQVPVDGAAVPSVHANPAASQLPGSMPLGEVGEGAMEKLSGLLGKAGEGAVSVVIPFVLKHLLAGVKWGVQKTQESTDVKDRPRFNSLLAAIDVVIANKELPVGKVSQLLEAVQDFMGGLKATNTQLLFNGVPLCLLSPGADFTATPNYDRAIMNQKLKNLPQVVPTGKTDLSQFKRDFSQYAGMRLTYEMIAGLSPADTSVYSDMFKKGNDLKILKAELFAALERANADGSLSRVRMWIAKFLFHFVQPICKYFVVPFLDNVENQLRPMLKKEAIETTSKELIDEFTNYLGSIVKRFQDAAEGNYDGAGTLDFGMAQKVKDPQYNHHLTVDQRARKVIQEAVSRFAPEFTFASRALHKLRSLGFDESSSFKILNPLVTCSMVIPFVLALIFLYLPQMIINGGMKWGIKQVMMTKSQVLDDVIQDIARASSKDRFIERARLQAMQSFLLRMIEGVKSPKPVKEEEEGSTGQISEKKQFDSLVSHMLLAAEYGSSTNIEELQKMMKARIAQPQDILSFIGINLKNLIDNETHARTVENLSESYRQVLNEDLIPQEIEDLLKMLSGLFDPSPETPEELAKEIAELESTNADLLTELINFSIGKAVEDQFDMTGKAQMERLSGVITRIKTGTLEFVNNARIPLNSAENLDVQCLCDDLRAFDHDMKKLFKGKLKEHPQIVALETEFVTGPYHTYGNAVLALLEDPNSLEKRAAALEALKAFESWEETVLPPENINISLFADKVQGVIGIVKNQVRKHAESQVRKIENFILKPYNIAGVTHMVLGMFGDKKFPFQKNS